MKIGIMLISQRWTRLPTITAYPRKTILREATTSRCNSSRLQSVLTHHQGDYFRHHLSIFQPILINKNFDNIIRRANTGNSSYSNKSSDSSTSSSSSSSNTTAATTATSISSKNRDNSDNTSNRQIYWTKNKRLQRIVSDIVAVNGFVQSCIRSLMSKQQQREQWNQNIKSIQQYLQSKQLDQEFISVLYNRRIYNNIRILSIVEKRAMLLQQQQQLPGGKEQVNIADRRDFVLAHQEERPSKADSKEIPIPSSHEALRYMKFATATYGDEMIRSTEISRGVTSTNSFSNGSGSATNSFNNFMNYFNATTTTSTSNKNTKDTKLLSYMKDRVSKHCSIPQNDIIHMDIDHHGDLNHSRHLIAVDHVHRSIVLAIRGTFTIAEVITDLTGHSRPFYNGMAHDGFATMAERTWNVVSPIIYDLLQRHEDYEFIITGHSLGGAVASLINIMVHHDAIIRQQISTLGELRPIRCIVYAAAPTHTEPMFNCINYIYDQDVVSFLSLYSVRHLLFRLRAINDEPLSWYERVQFIYNPKFRQKVLPSLIDTISNASKTYHDQHYVTSGTKDLNNDDNVPLIIVPACKNIWMKKSDTAIIDTSLYNCKVCDSVAMAKMGIVIEPSPNNTMFSDHLCARYEEALLSLSIDDSE